MLAVLAAQLERKAQQEMLGHEDKLAQALQVVVMLEGREETPGVRRGHF